MKFSNTLFQSPISQDRDSSVSSLDHYKYASAPSESSVTSDSRQNSGNGTWLDNMRGRERANHSYICFMYYAP